MRIDYTPERWVIVKIKSSSDTLYKVFGVWFGGYTYGDSWKLNSGISGYQDSEKYIDMEGYSGSVYRLHKNAENNLSMYGQSILSNLLSHSSEESELSLISLEEFLKEFENKP